MIDLRQSKNYAKYLKSEGWIVVRNKNTNYFLKKFPLIGSFLKVQRPFKIDFDYIEKLVRKYNVFSVSIEPINYLQIKELLDRKYKLSKSPYLPTKTLLLNLKESKDKIYAKFSKKCRYSIRRGETIKLKNLYSPKDIKLFYQAWKKSYGFNKYVPSLESLINLKNSYPQNNSIFLASHNMFGSIIGGAIFTITLHKRSNYIISYLYGFTNKEGRSTLSQYSLLYHVILWGKKMGCKIFDFEGIYDSRFPDKRWLGFTHFKKEFGGYEFLYPGCYIKHTNIVDVMKKIFSLGF